MTSPPPPSSATSPPAPSSLTLPRQRPTLALPGQSAKSRKPSIASSTTSSAHPLRQTSFPPAESLEAQHAAAEDRVLRYSPSQASQGSLEDEFSDSEIVSAISAPAAEDGVTKKRKRGEKKPRGRPAKVGKATASLADGEDGQSTPAGKRGGTAGAASVVTADNADDEDDEYDDAGGGGGRMPLYDGGQLTEEKVSEDAKNKGMFRNYMDIVDSLPLTDPSRSGMTTRDMGDRYDTWYRAKLRTADVRRLVNQTLSQSVPANVVTVVSSYTKMFAGLLIEGAREVQEEWLAVEKERADGEVNPTYKRVQRSSDDLQGPNGEAEPNKASPEPTKSSSSPTTKLATATATADSIKKEPASSSSPTQPDTQLHEHSDQQDPPYPGGAAGLETALEECDRGPLLPDHLREALRRYKKARKGGTVGFTGLSLEGRETAAARMGGRRMFR